MLSIIYQDDFFVAINKPSGLLVHPSLIDKHEKTSALTLLSDQLDQPVYPVHRLDKPTSGVLVFALNKVALSALSKQFADHSASTLKKTYLAVVRGFPAPSGEIDHPVKAIKNFSSDKKTAKSAATAFERVATTTLNARIDRYAKSRFSLMKLFPKTGRRHQLRYHMKHIAHPIIGDAKYGKGRYNRYFADHFGCNRLLLAACELHFIHPITQHTINIKASLDNEFMGVITQLGFEYEAGSIYEPSA